MDLPSLNALVLIAIQDGRVNGAESPCADGALHRMNRQSNVAPCILILGILL